MAKEMIVRCDANLTVRVKDCGEVHDNTRTFTIRTDGEVWEIDLGGPHAEALLELAQRGRMVDAGKSRPQDIRALERRIRHVPGREE